MRPGTAIDKLNSRFPKPKKNNGKPHHKLYSADRTVARVICRLFSRFRCNRIIARIIYHTIIAVCRPRQNGQNGHYCDSADRIDQ